MNTLVVGQQETLWVVYLDQHGLPMRANPVLDKPLVWTHVGDFLSPMIGVEEVMMTAMVAGTDTVSVEVSVGGVKYDASEQIEVVAASPVAHFVGTLATGSSSFTFDSNAIPA